MEDYDGQDEETNEVSDINLETILTAWEGNVQIRQQKQDKICTFTAQQVSQMISTPDLFTVIAHSSLTGT